MKQPEPLYKLLDWIDTNKLDWVNLSKNSNPNVISFLEKNPHKIDWKCLCENLNAIPLLEANQDKIDWNWLLRNPNAIPLIEKILNV
jgi:hypothetical protein